MGEDTLGGAGWVLDPAARRAVLLVQSRHALATGDPAAAVVLAEELLDDTPGEVEALLVIADAAPRYGHGEVGALAAVQAARLGAETGALQAAALLSACSVQEALTVAEQTLERRPDDARAHAVRGQALDLLGRRGEADLALGRAHALRPDAYPLSLRVGADAWDGILLTALSGLDDSLRDLVRTAQLEVCDLPDVARLAATQPPPSPLADVLLLDPDATPLEVQVYRRNLCRGAASEAELTDRLRQALAAELELALTEDD